jgi:hypothetical protein
MRRVPLSRTAAALATSLLALAATTHRFSPGWTYRLTVTSRAAAPADTSAVVVLSGRASVTAAGARLDVDESSRALGAIADAGAYVLADSDAMMVVSNRTQRILRFAAEDVERGTAALAFDTLGLHAALSGVVVHVDSLGAGEPVAGIPTRRWRITQDYTLELRGTGGPGITTEHVVREIWLGEPRAGLANPFASVADARAGGDGAYAALADATDDAARRLGRGVPLRVVTTATSTGGAHPATTTVTTLEVSDLAAADVDVNRLAAPPEFAATDVGPQAKTVAARMARAEAAQEEAAVRASRGAGAPARAARGGSHPPSSDGVKDAQAAKDAARAAIVGGLGRLSHPP